VDTENLKPASRPVHHPTARKTHYLERKGADYAIRRRCFDCGFDS